MDAMRRRPMIKLEASDIPTLPGVYTLYRDGKAVYVGKAKSLRQRIWRNHSGRGRSMSSSAMRRNVAQHLGFGSANDIKLGVLRLAEEQVAAVRGWMDGCEIAWIECADESAAVALEKGLKAETVPPLTKQ